MKDHAEAFIQRQTEKYFQICIQNPGEWIHLTPENCGRNREEVYNRIRDLLKLMGIRYSITDTFPMGFEDYGHVFKIKVQKNEAQDVKYKS